MKAETKLTIGSAIATLGKPRPKFHLPVDHRPYLVLRSDSFSCANCVFLRTKRDGFHCSSSDFRLYFGSTLLREADGKTPLLDPSRACSDWFVPTGR